MIENGAGPKQEVGGVGGDRKCGSEAGSGSKPLYLKDTLKLMLSEKRHSNIHE